MFNMYGKIMQTLDNSPPVASTTFPVPFSIETIREDILTLYFQQVRTMAWIQGAESAAKLLNSSQTIAESLLDPDKTPKDLGIDYRKISQTDFAKSIEYMYQYAYFGIVDISYESLESESIHTWVAAILSDMAISRVSEEWDAYGLDVITPAKRCLEIAELAVARKSLEGYNDIVFHFSSKNKDDEMDTDFLTVRQMALLAGMEEMSIRAAANPKRANPLPTISVDGRTRISIEAAKTWLISKGRYVNIRKVYPSDGIDLTKHHFVDLIELMHVLSEQIQILETKSPKGFKYSNRDLIAFFSDSKRLLNSEEVSYLASELELNANLLSLKIREALANQELSEVEAQLKLLTSKSNGE